MNKNIEWIEYAAFYSCPSIETVIFCGTEEEKNAMDLEECNDDLVNAEWIYHTEHSYSDDFDLTCDICGYERKAPYSLQILNFTHQNGYSFDIYANTELELKGKIICALYDDEQLVSTKILDAAKSSSVQFSETGDLIRVFWWNDILVPMSTVCEYEIK